MKKLLCFAICCLLIHSQSVWACTDGKAVISGSIDYPPLSWREGNKLVGTNIELVQNILSEKDVEATTDEGGPWKRVLERARRGEVDILVGVRKTPEREKYLTYIEPQITPAVQGVFLMAKDVDNYQGWETLKGMAGGIKLGASFGDEFDAYAKENLHIEETRTLAQNFKKLTSGRIDYILGPLMTIILNLQKEDLIGEVINSDIELLVLDEYVAISKKSECIEYIDHFSTQVKSHLEDGRLDTIMEKYFEKWIIENNLL